MKIKKMNHISIIRFLALTLLMLTVNSCGVFTDFISVITGTDAPSRTCVPNLAVTNNGFSSTQRKSVTLKANNVYTEKNIMIEGQNYKVPNFDPNATEEYYKTALKVSKGDIVNIQLKNSSAFLYAPFSYPDNGDYLEAYYRGEYNPNTKIMRGKRLVIDENMLAQNNRIIDTKINIVAGDVVIIEFADPNEKILYNSTNRQEIEHHLVIQKTVNNLTKSNDYLHNIAQVELNLGGNKFVKPLLSKDNAQRVINHNVTQSGELQLRLNNKIYYNTKLVLFIKLLKRPIENSSTDILKVKFINQKNANSTNIQTIGANETINIKDNLDGSELSLKVTGHPSSNWQSEGEIELLIENASQLTLISPIINKYVQMLKDKMYDSAKILYNNIVINTGFLFFLHSMLTIWIIVYAMGYILGTGRAPIGEIIFKTIKISVIASVTSENGWDFITTYIYDAIFSASSFLTQSLHGVINSGLNVPTSQINPFVIFDDILAIFLDTGLWFRILGSIAINPLMAIFFGIPAFLIFSAIVKTLLRYLMAYIFTMVSICVMLVLGPFIIPFSLFKNQTFKSIFERYYSINIRLMLDPFMLLIGISIIVQLIYTIIIIPFSSMEYCAKCILYIPLNNIVMGYFLGAVREYIPIFDIIDTYLHDFIGAVMWELNMLFCIFGWVPWGFDLGKGNYGALIVVYRIFPHMLMGVILAKLLVKYTDFCSAFTDAISSVYMRGGMGKGGKNQQSGPFDLADTIFSAPGAALKGGKSLFDSTIKRAFNKGGQNQEEEDKITKEELEQARSKFNKKDHSPLDPKGNHHGNDDEDDDSPPKGDLPRPPVNEEPPTEDETTGTDTASDNSDIDEDNENNLEAEMDETKKNENNQEEGNDEKAKDETVKRRKIKDNDND